MTLLGIVTDFRKGQLKKAASQIEVTLSGMVMEARPVSSKAKFPIEVTLSGMVMEVKLLHLPKTQLSIKVTLLGIVIDFKLMQL